MSNTLKVSMSATIKKLGERGWSALRIARELGVHRNTMRNYLGNESNCTISTAGLQSLCAAYDECIRERIKLGLSAMRIIQDMSLESAFEGSYESILRPQNRRGC